MDPDYLIFAKVVETGSLSAAARAMLVSPATVSKRLARVEARLGVRLIHRTTRKLALTEAGARFHADISAILRAVGDAEGRVMGTRGEPAGALRVTAPTSFGRLHITPRLHMFLDRFPRVQLELDLSDSYVDLVATRFDLAIRITSERPASLVSHRLGGSRRILCASPIYLDRYGTPSQIGELAHHRLLAATDQLPWRLVNAGRRHVVHGQSHVRTNSSEVVRELAVTGVGIALRSLWDIDGMLRAGTLVPILPGWEGPHDLSVYAVHPRAPSTPAAVSALVQFLQTSLSPSPWEADLDS